MLPSLSYLHLLILLPFIHQLKVRILSSLQVLSNAKTLTMRLTSKINLIMRPILNLRCPLHSTLKEQSMFILTRTNIPIVWMLTKVVCLEWLTLRWCLMRPLPSKRTVQSQGGVSVFQTQLPISTILISSSILLIELGWYMLIEIPQ